MARQVWADRDDSSGFSSLLREARQREGPLMAQVLIVDDQVQSARMLSTALAFLGHQPIEAYHGQEALEIVRHGGADLILLDYMMPGMNGLETLEQIRNLPDARHIPIYFLTAAQDRYLEERALIAGASGMLIKPISIKTLESVLPKRGNGSA